MSEVKSAHEHIEHVNRLLEQEGVGGQEIEEPDGIMNSCAYKRVISRRPAARRSDEPALLVCDRDARRTSFSLLSPKRPICIWSSCHPDVRGPGAMNCFGFQESPRAYLTTPHAHSRDIAGAALERTRRCVANLSIQT